MKRSCLMMILWTAVPFVGLAFAALTFGTIELVRYIVYHVDPGSTFNDDITTDQATILMPVAAFPVGVWLAVVLVMKVRSSR